MKRIIIKMIYLILSINILAFSGNLNLELKMDNEKLKDKIEVELEHKKENFEFKLKLPFYNDGRYKFNEDKFYAGHYFMMKEGYTKIKLNNHLELKGGRFIQEDEINSPYSLYFSSEENSALSYEIKYEDDFFFYKSRWLGLNKNSDFDFIDRGANYKVYGMKFGKYRFGYQDIVVYTNEYFNIEYFLNPLPAYFVQEGNHSMDAPWNQDTNENSIMGFFVDRRTKKDYYYIQILIDDFNGNRFFDRESYQNPDKVAWSLGYKGNYKKGKLGIYTAGATKYTFEPMGNKGANTNYGYTYYPEVEYGSKEINLSENYIGYKYGENNLSFLVDYEKNKIYNSIEYILNGSKSPANPWHKYLTWDEGGQGARFLDDDKLEKELKWNIGIKKGEWDFNLTLGKIWNKLKLEEAGTEEENKIKIYRPSNKNENICEMKISKKIELLRGKR